MSFFPKLLAFSCSFIRVQISSYLVLKLKNQRIVYLERGKKGQFEYKQKNTKMKTILAYSLYPLLGFPDSMVKTEALYK